MPHKGSNPNYKSSPGHKKPAALKDKTKLRSAYTPSGKAQDVLTTARIERASRGGYQGPTHNELGQGPTIKRVGQARQATADLAAENRRLRRKKQGR